MDKKTIFKWAIPLVALYGTLVSRFHGGGFVGGFPKIIKNLLWSIPMTAMPLLNGIPHWGFIVSALGMNTFGKATGHGGGMDLATSHKEPNGGRDKERLEFLVYWAYDKLPRYWYDFSLLVVIGLASVSGAVLLLALTNPIGVIPALIGGAMKSVAYAIGWKIYPKGSGKGIPHFTEATAIGEGLAGLFAFTGVALGVII